MITGIDRERQMAFIREQSAFLQGPGAVPSDNRQITMHIRAKDGQPELRGKLKMRTFDALAQRVQGRYHLSGLAQDQVGPYIEHHMRLAGATRPIFSDHAVSALAALTRGIPRLINADCVSCLLDACTRDQKVVDEASVSRVASEFDEADRAASGW